MPGGTPPALSHLTSPSSPLIPLFLHQERHLFFFWPYFPLGSDNRPCQITNPSPSLTYSIRLIVYMCKARISSVEVHILESLCCFMFITITPLGA